MNHSQAKRIIQALVQGDHPLTGKELPPDSILNHVEVTRALLIAVSSIDQVSARQARRSLLPESVGKTWSTDEEATLNQEFQSGLAIAEIAEAHGRTVRAIEARLERLGLITSEQRTTNNSFSGAPTKIEDERNRHGEG